MVKNPPANAGDVGLIPGSGRSTGEGNGNPLQYSCLENSTDRGAWGLQSTGSQRARHDSMTEHTHSPRPSVHPHSKGPVALVVV